MDSLKIAEVSQVSMKKAVEFIKNHQYTRAFPHLLVYLELNPHKRAEIEAQFEHVLVKHTQNLTANEQELSYENAIRYYPHNKRITDAYYTFLACHNAHKALKTIPNKTMRHRKLLDTCKCQLVERWHFRMLNDKKRNDAYRTAIENHIKRTGNGKVRIMDIGTGSGILAVYAWKTCVKLKRECDIHACDTSLTMCEIARDVFHRNDSNIHLIHGNSTDLNARGEFNQRANGLGSDSDNQPIDLIVTEIFDAAIFGEGALQTLVSCHANLLKPDGKIVPEQCQIAITATNLNRKRTVTCLHIFSEQNIPYNSENLTESNFKSASMTTTANFHVNFNDVNDLCGFSSRGRRVDVRATRRGVIDSIVVYFTLILDAENNVYYTTKPRADSFVAWEQAVFYLKKPIPVDENDRISFLITCTDHLNVNIIDKPDVNVEIVPEKIVRLLNDAYLLGNINKFDRALIGDFSPCPVLALNRTCLINAQVQGLFEKVTDMAVERLDLDLDRKTWTRDGVFFLFDIFETTGVLNMELVDKYVTFLARVPNPRVVFPRKVWLYVQVIYSDWLEFVTRVRDENVGVEVAEFVNAYRCEEHLDIDLSQFAYKQVSAPVRAAELGLGVAGMAERTTATQLLDVEIILDCPANGLLYWYGLETIAGLEIQTNRVDSFINVAAFLLPEPYRRFNAGDFARLEVQTDGGLFHVSLV